MGAVLILPRRAAISVGRDFITAGEIAKGLGGRKSGAGWMCRCPGHDDREPSLSLKHGDNGQPIFYCFAGCSQSQVLDALKGLGLWPASGERGAYQPPPPRARKKQEPDDDAEPTSLAAPRIWRESIDSTGKWAEQYLHSRGLVLPVDPDIRCRTLRYHPDARRLGKPFFGPALIAAFCPVPTKVPSDPFDDPPPVAIHRIKGRGTGNKFMLGPTAGAAVMISPWWHVREVLHVCEGVETALSVYADHRPVWALGTAGAIRTFPVIQRVQKLVIWADHDESRRSLTDARECAKRWTASGRRVVIRYPEQPGADYAD